MQLLKKISHAAGFRPSNSLPPPGKIPAGAHGYRCGRFVHVNWYRHFIRSC